MAIGKRYLGFQFIEIIWMCPLVFRARAGRISALEAAGRYWTMGPLHLSREADCPPAISADKKKRL
jgi:hypothetical protein